MVYIDVYTTYKKKWWVIGDGKFGKHGIGLKITIVVPSDFNQLSLDITIIRDSW